MRRFAGIVIAAVFILMVPGKVLAWVPLQIIPTVTVTPTPTKTLIQVNPNLIHNIQYAGTNSPTPTVITFPSSTVTASVSPTVKLNATITPFMEAGGTATVAAIVTATPIAKPATAVSGFTKKDMLFAGLVIVLLILIVVQGNWAKIKIWLHRKTE